MLPHKAFANNYFLFTVCTFFPAINYNITCSVRQHYPFGSSAFGMRGESALRHRSGLLHVCHLILYWSQIYLSILKHFSHLFLSNLSNDIPCVASEMHSSILSHSFVQKLTWYTTDLDKNKNTTAICYFYHIRSEMWMKLQLSYTVIKDRNSNDKDTNRFTKRWTRRLRVQTLVREQKIRRKPFKTTFVPLMWTLVSNAVRRSNWWRCFQEKNKDPPDVIRRYTALTEVYLFRINFAHRSSTHWTIYWNCVTFAVTPSTHIAPIFI